MCCQRLCEFLSLKNNRHVVKVAVLEASLNYLFFWASSRDKCMSICSMLGTVSAEKKYNYHQRVNYRCFQGPVLYMSNLEVAWGPHRWALTEKELQVKTQVCNVEDFWLLEKHRINHNELQVWGKSSASCRLEFCLPGPTSSQASSLLWNVSHLSYLWICTIFGRSFEVERL